jgi:N-acetylglucosaminyldiphosphoundecaprenol N-acetyl-beta-D-mannosaminyltransferase
MTLLLVFFIAALLTLFILRLPRATSTDNVLAQSVDSENAPRRVPRLEGLVIVFAILIATAFGLWRNDQVNTGKFIEPIGLAFLAATGVLYLLLSIRTRLQLPAWIADVAILVVAYVLMRYVDVSHRITSFHFPLSQGIVNLAAWSLPLSVIWIWLVSRATAALNRSPQVTGGYLGLVAMTLLLLYKLGPEGGRPQDFFPTAASAALAGAGLMSVLVAIKRPNFSLGWAGSCALGFLLAHITIVGLFKSIALALLLPMLLLFGLPLLDVVFVKMRASKHGEEVAWEKREVRLHEALRERGISPAKIAFLYLSISAYTCALALLMVALASWSFWIRALIVLPLAFVGFIVFFSVTRVLMRRVPGETVPEDIEAFGVRLSPVSMSEAMDKIEGFIRDGKPHHVVTSDANSILRAQQDEEYAAIVRRAALITPDGYGVMWGARLMNLPIYERVTGVDMVTGICERAAKNGDSIYILGAAPGVAAKAAEKLAERFPGLRVAGTRNGFFKPEEEDDVVKEIRDAKPQVLFVAFGIPKQEKFIAKHLEILNVPVSLGVGGSFDVYSENLKRAPEYIQRSGMEWLYRVWQEPWRWRRMSYVPRFMIFALREWLFGPPPNRTTTRGKTVI